MDDRSHEAAAKAVLGAGAAAGCVYGAFKIAEYAAGQAIVAGAALPALTVLALMLLAGVAIYALAHSG